MVILPANCGAFIDALAAEAAIGVARSGMSIENAARKYGVSPKMMQFRLNVSGA
jgi:hypothetical protein